ncbi:cadherin-like protein 26 [Rhinichthys klamathensis goyatoka]|uniref:cadherin-like protein 26 n=1 Tax=Rhinichthys klamathensis goyatoka TaxID=3034132 RepID=UPI0024B5CF7F|nr:cadherin-like protein 26 [Rhinichthys klamathensis goyatoka]
MTGTFFLFLLALVEVTASSKNDAGNREKREAVLIRSKRRWVLSTVDLEENRPGPYPIELTQMYNDKKDNSVKFRLQGDGVTREPFGLFSINENTGVVFVHRPIDREVNPIFHVDFDVLDRQTDKELDKTLSFNVDIKDLNDNSPKFSPEMIRVPVQENTPEGILQATLQAHDNDQPDTPNSQFTMRVVSQEPALPKISLKDIPGTTKIKQLTFTGCFDYDIVKTYKVLVEAKDNGTPAMSSTGTIFLDIRDTNTHLPEFKSATYNTEVKEMESNKEILRIGVTDKDTPNTAASRAVFSILKGNEDGNYKIETDPATNEGVLSVIKGKNFEKSELTEVEIGVENEEKLFQCVNGKALTGSTPKLNSVKVAVKVIDENDPPQFKKTTEVIYRNENGYPGDVLFVPEVKDEDSDLSKIRYELVQDPAKWVSVDRKTGKITTVQKMDRESPFIKNGTYTVVVHAIDDGQPPATGTCTVVVFLGDVNDNAPYLTSKNMIMCGNKVDRVNVIPADLDGPPFSTPFTFSLGGGEALRKLWKPEPATGVNTSLISLTSLPYGNYSIPLKIQDQQGLESEEVLQVVVCECVGEGTVCRGALPSSSRLGPAAIGLLLAGLLLLLLLLLLSFCCDCRSTSFQHIPLNMVDEGNQTIVKYNEEGGGSVYKPESTLTSNFGLMESMKIGSAPSESLVTTDGYRMADSSMLRIPGRYNSIISNVGGARSVSMYRGERGRFMSGGSQMSRSLTYTQTQRNLSGRIERKISGLPEAKKDYPEYSPYLYEYEGKGSDCQSLDQLTVSNLGDNLDFLQDLGPKFSTLGEICQRPVERRNVRL